MRIISKDTATSLAKQGAILAFAGLLVRFIGFLYRVPLTNMLGDLGNGIYGSSYYIYMFFLMLSSAGLPVAISKMVSERLAFDKYREAHQIFRISMIFAIVIGTICMLILFFGANFFDSTMKGTRYGLKSLAPTVLIVSIMSVYRGYFQGMKDTVPTAFSQIIEQILNAFFSILLCFVLLKLPFSQNAVGGPIAMGAAGGTMGTGIGALAGLITLMIIYKKRKKDIFKNCAKDRNFIKEPNEIFKELFFTSIPIIAGAAIFTLTNFIDFMVESRLQVAGFTRVEATALYGQLTGKYLVIVALPVSISSSIATASIPEIATSAKNNLTKEVHEKINVAVKLTMIISIPAAVGVGVLGNQILLFLSPSHPDGGILLAVGSVSIIFISLTQIFSGMMQGLSRFYVPVIAGAIGAIFKVIINYTLIAIPSINIIGAVIGTIVCYIIASTINYFVLRKITKVNIDFMCSFVKPVFASALMGMVVYNSYYLVYDLISSNALALFCSIIIGVIVYFIVLISINGASKEEISMLPGGSRIIRLLS